MSDVIALMRLLENVEKRVVDVEAVNGGIEGRVFFRDGGEGCEKILYAEI